MSEHPAPEHIGQCVPEGEMQCAARGRDVFISRGGVSPLRKTRAEDSSSNLSEFGLQLI